MKILLLDDDQSFRELVAAEVRADGHDVVEAETAADALRLLREDVAIGVVVMELKLNKGEITGPEFMMLHSYSRGNHQGFVIISRDGRGIVMEETQRYARAMGCEVHGIIPHDDVLRILPKRLTHMALDGIMQGEEAQG